MYYAAKKGKRRDDPFCKTQRFVCNMLCVRKGERISANPKLTLSPPSDHLLNWSLIFFLIPNLWFTINQFSLLFSRSSNTNLQISREKREKKITFFSEQRTKKNIKSLACELLRSWKNYCTTNFPPLSIQF